MPKTYCSSKVFTGFVMDVLSAISETDSCSDIKSNIYNIIEKPFSSGCSCSDNTQVLPAANYPSHAGSYKEPTKPKKRV